MSVRDKLRVSVCERERERERERKNRCQVIANVHEYLHQQEFSILQLYNIYMRTIVGDYFSLKFKYSPVKI